MHMVRQYDPAIDVERHQNADTGHDMAQQFDLIDQQRTISIAQIDREEIGGASHAMTSIFRHIGKLYISVNI